VTRVPLSSSELEAHLKEQIAFLEASTESYDCGFHGEAKRLAVTIRILLHDHGSNKALLAQLGRLNSMRFFDSAEPNPPGNIGTYSGLVVTAHTKHGAEYMPMLDDNQVGPGEWVPFDSWWETAIFVDNKKRKISRKDLILSLANQDGGAHVDPALNETYSALSKENSMGWTVTKGDIAHPMGPPHLASVRQIAHELLKSLDQRYTKNGPKRDDVLMYSAGAAVVEGDIPKVTPPFLGPKLITPAVAIPKIGRNAPCFCGSGKKYKRCHGAAR
jgi:SEC-C motif